MSIRITAGLYGGRTLASPKDNAIRPTTGRVRESLFAHLAPRLHGARFLDLFAGCGVMGLEALSRGANFVMAVEKAPAHVRLIRENYDKLKIPREAHKILNLDALALLKKGNPQADLPFDVAYLDPPYDYSHYATVVDAIVQGGWLADGGLIIAEHSPGLTLNNVAYTKTYGDTVLSFFERGERP